MNRKLPIFGFLIFFWVNISTPFVIFAQSSSINANSLSSRASVSLSPQTGTFVNDSTFEVPILLNTRGVAINGVDIKVSFDPDKLSIVKPSSGQSIIGVWVEPPSFDNTKGTASYVGVVPNGITTASGLIGTITFKAKGTGKAGVSIKQNSVIYLNDGLGTEAGLDAGRSEYTIISKAPDGVKVFSETHPFSGDWYNNNNPVISWDRDGGVTGFSYVVDDKPSTIPENKINTTDTTIAFEGVKDGLMYFHIKAYKNGVWGNTTHFLLKIDRTPPADFKPEVNYILAAAVLVERALVSFFTTDNLSGIDHYEVGVISDEQSLTESPVFVESESPYQLSIKSKTKSQVIVRAIDKAGNVRDSAIQVEVPFFMTQFIKDNLVYILLGIILISLFALIFHYLFGHHILSHFKKALDIVKEEEKNEHKE